MNKKKKNSSCSYNLFVRFANLDILLLFVCNKLSRTHSLHDAYLETFQVLAVFFSRKLLTLRGVRHPTKLKSKLGHSELEH